MHIIDEFNFMRIKEVLQKENVGPDKAEMRVCCDNGGNVHSGQESS